jgi:hypothetical protein
MKKLTRILKQLKADAAGPGDTTDGSRPVANHHGYVAQGALDLLSESKRVSIWWSTGTNGTTYPLVYITSAQFVLKVTSFENSLNARIALGTERPMETKSLHDLDDDIDTAVKQMRLDIGNKFGAENRFAMFPQFGFIRRREQWEFPRDRDLRLNSIKLCKNACIANGMTAIIYNDAWWTQMESDYKTALEATQTTDSDVSGAVAAKNPDFDAVDEVLHSLYHVIRGNHPKDYKQILRVAGFQKEDM